MRKQAVYGFGIGLLGILIAMILYEMNARSLVIDSFIVGNITIEALMSLVIILFVLLGTILGMMHR